MQKTKIEWVKNPDGTQGYTWNPIRGLCPVGCWYCYARRMYKRFGWDSTIRLEEKRRPRDFKNPLKIFVCSTFEIFHPQISKRWRDIIFQTIQDCPWHTFQILTKMPQNIDRPMPDNVWLGVTVTNQQDLSRMSHLCLTKAKKRFVSFEPLLGHISWSGFRYEFSCLDWIIVGRLTQHRNKYDPPKWLIHRIVEYSRHYGVSAFLKDNLKEIWGEDLIQEFPK